METEMETETESPSLIGKQICDTDQDGSRQQGEAVIHDDGDEHRSRFGDNNEEPASNLEATKHEILSEKPAPSNTRVMGRTKMAICRDLVGRRIQLFSEPEEKWWEGTIVQFIESSGKHVVEFDQNSKRKRLRLEEYDFRWIDLRGPKQRWDAHSLATSKYAGVQRETGTTWLAFRSTEETHTHYGALIGRFASERDAALANDVYLRREGHEANIQDEEITEAQIEKRKTAFFLHGHKILNATNKKKKLRGIANQRAGENKWTARYWERSNYIKKRIVLGNFRCIEHAALAYDVHARKRGRYSSLNYPSVHATEEEIDLWDLSATKLGNEGNKADEPPESNLDSAITHESKRKFPRTAKSSFVRHNVLSNPKGNGETTNARSVFEPEHGTWITVGDKVAVRQENGRYYEAAVLAIDERRVNKYHLDYGEGDEEWQNLERVDFFVVTAESTSETDKPVEFRSPGCKVGIATWLSVEWETGVTYDGIVTRFRPSNQNFALVEYEDGDRSWHDLRRETFAVIEADRTAPLASQSNESPADDESVAVGKVIAIKWSNGLYYEGIVRKTRPSKDLFYVDYKDGDKRWHSLKEEFFIVRDDKAGPKSFGGVQTSNNILVEWDGHMYEGFVSRLRPDKTCFAYIEYSADGVKAWHDLRTENYHVIYAVGTKVYKKFGGLGFFWGEIAKCIHNEDGTLFYEIDYADGDKECILSNDNNSKALLKELDESVEAARRERQPKDK